MGKKKIHRKVQKRAPVKGKQLLPKPKSKRSVALKVALIVLFLVLAIALSLLAHYLSMFSIKDSNH